MALGERYAEGFWPLAVLPLVLAGAGVAVLFHSSALAVTALVLLMIPAALGELVIWRALKAKWMGERQSLWPWSQGMLTGLEVTFLFAAQVALGSWKAHDIQGGTWPAAVVFSALVFGGLYSLIVVIAVVERRLNGPR